MSALTPERLAELRERAEWASLGPSAARELLAHVDHLTAEGARLRAGIECLTRVDYSHTPDCDREREAGWLNWHPDCGRCWEDRLVDLINQPTEGGSDAQR